MTAIALSGNPTDSFSNPWIEYASDTLYVGDDSGQLHQFAPVFSATATTPVAETLTAWPVTLVGSLGSPVFDTGTGKVFVGSSVWDFLRRRRRRSGVPRDCFGPDLRHFRPLWADPTEEIIDAPIVDSARRGNGLRFCTSGLGWQQRSLPIPWRVFRRALAPNNP